MFNNIVKIFCLIVILVCVSNVQNFEVEDRITDGYPIAIIDRPFQVLLKVMRPDGTYMCGGSIINRQWILTAAHCVHNAQNVMAQVGSTYASSAYELHVAQQFIVHDKYGITLDYDIALVQLIHALSFENPNIQPARLPLPGHQLTPGTKVTVSGWGWLSNSTIPNHLQAVDVDVIDTDKCRYVYHQLLPTQICAGVPAGGKDSCQGDSGGPLTLYKSNLVVGIVSFGKQCGLRGYPGVYTDVAPFTSWIHHIIQRE